MARSIMPPPMGIHGFTKALAQEGAGRITVNAIAPAIRYRHGRRRAPEVLEKIVAKTRWAARPAEEIARGVLFLCADNAGFCHRSTLSSMAASICIEDAVAV